MCHAHVAKQRGHATETLGMLAMLRDASMGPGASRPQFPASRDSKPQRTTKRTVIAETADLGRSVPLSNRDHKSHFKRVFPKRTCPKKPAFQQCKRKYE